MTRPAFLISASAIVIAGVILLLEIDRNSREEALATRLKTLEEAVDELRNLIARQGESNTKNLDESVASLQAKLTSVFDFMHLTIAKREQFRPSYNHHSPGKFSHELRYGSAS